MKMEEVTALLGSDWTAVRELTCSVLSSDIPLLKSVNDSLLSNPGKQLRPMLALLVAGALGHVNRDSIHYAAAAELLHNATLLHDDVVDRSATRRGKPTVASMLGDTPAVLVGDFWLSKAVDTIIGTRHQDIVTPLFSRTLADLRSVVTHGQDETIDIRHLIDQHRVDAVRARNSPAPVMSTSLWPTS